MKILGIIFSILGIVMGFFVLNHMFKFNTKKTQTEQAKVEFKKKKFKKNFFEEKPFLVKKSIKALKKKPFKTFGYQVNLSNFLIPLSKKEFLKVNITVFLARYEQIKEFKKKEFIYKKFFYDFLKNLPSSVWYDEKKLQNLGKRAVNELKKEGIVPVPLKIRFDGAILKG